MTTPDDTDLLLLDGDWGSLGVTRLGATVSSWRPRGVERLFTAGDATPALGRMWQGGIPVCAPWFGVGQGDWEAPHKHGLVNLVEWQLDEVVETADRTTVRLSLGAARFAGLPGAARYPSDLQFTYEVALGRALRCTLTALSPSLGFTMDHALHPYFAVSDIEDVELRGLEELAFRDYARGGSTGASAAPIRFGHHIDRVYDAAPAVELHDHGRGTGLRLSAEGAASTIVWSPGVEAGPTTRGLSGDEWRRFVCVEYGSVQGKASLLEPGIAHTLRFTAEPIDS